jgi:hypothetical protein
VTRICGTDLWADSSSILDIENSETAQVSSVIEEGRRLGIALGNHTSSYFLVHSSQTDIRDSLYQIYFVVSSKYRIVVVQAAQNASLVPSAARLGLISALVIFFEITFYRIHCSSRLRARQSCPRSNSVL